MAAGLGTRMRSDTPKHLHPILGRRMVDWVLAAAAGVGAEPLVVVAAPSTADAFDGLPVAIQPEPRGTGDAVRSAREALAGVDDVLVLSGDTPLLRAEALRELVEAHRRDGAVATVLSFEPDDPKQYGRVLRAPDGTLSSIVEYRDATDAERAVREVNSSIYVFAAARLWPVLERLSPHNAQGELYLTDSVGLLVEGGDRVAVHKGDDPVETEGVNTRVELAAAGAALRERINAEHMLAGVTIVDPANTVGGFGNQPGYSTLVVHGSGPAYYDARNVPHGAVTRHIYHSAVTNGEREIFVYTPPGYDPKKKYPVLYLVGGSGELASNWALEGRANFILDNLLAEGKAVPMIIAMPNNQVVHRSHPKHVELTFNLFGEELRKHIVPFVEKNYSVQANRKGRALAGLSMGGGQTFNIGFAHLDLFSALGVFSSAPGPDFATKFKTVLEDAKGTNAKLNVFWYGTGDKDPVFPRAKDTSDLLNKQQIRHTFRVYEGGLHTWPIWRRCISEFVPLLFQGNKTGA